MQMNGKNINDEGNKQQLDFVDLNVRKRCPLNGKLCGNKTTVLFFAASSNSICASATYLSTSATAELEMRSDAEAYCYCASDC